MSTALTVEENLIALGTGIRRETGTDVFRTDPQLNEWMQRVKQLGGNSLESDDSRRLEEVLFVGSNVNNRKFRRRGRRDLKSGRASPRVALLIQNGNARYRL
jgi:hypothetical protein